ncbi:MAG: YhbY family RNA-binding protein [Arenicellales bacterium]|jgi:RNA-binding protein
MNLKGKELNRLRGLAHHLKPIVTVGMAGVTPAVANELEIALANRELVKVRLPALPRPEKTKALQDLCDHTRSTPVQLIGRIGVVYRPLPS